MSAATHFGVDERLDKIVEMVKRTDANDVYHFENIQHKHIKVKKDSITKISEVEKPFLIEHNYITETDSQYIEVWEVYNQEIAKLVRQLPRGNDEAEGRFWKQMESKGILEEFENRGIQKGDVLKVLSPYE